MNGEDQTTDTISIAQTKSQDAPLWTKIRDDELYILNPLYRLCNCRFDARLVGALGLPTNGKIHKSTAVVLALCNGKRTVADIARITRPLVKNTDDAKATEIAKSMVKSIIYGMSHKPEEYSIGQPRNAKGNDDTPKYPLIDVLSTRQEYDLKIGGTKFRGVEYHARDFLPKDSSELTTRVPLYGMREMAPLSLTWHLTSECSTDCQYCYLGRRKVKLLPKERVLSLIDEAAAMKTPLIFLNGGDILLYPHLEEVLERVYERNFLPTQISTKSFLSRDKARILAQTSGLVWSLQFSIDSSVDDVADYLVGAKGFCDRIFKSIDNAREAGVRVAAKVVITPYNILTVPKLYRDLKKRGVDEIRLALYSRSSFHHSDDLFNHPASFQWLVEQTQKLQQEYPDDFIRIQNGPPDPAPRSPEDKQRAWAERNSCVAGRESMMICADGKVIPCEQMPETEEYFCGDVSYQSIQEVWDGDRLRDMTHGMPREKFRGQPCHNCAEWEKCNRQLGICVRDMSLEQGGIYLTPLGCPKSSGPFYRRV